MRKKIIFDKEEVESEYHDTISKKNKVDVNYLTGKQYSQNYYKIL
jgi:hypothetical protein